MNALDLLTKTPEGEFKPKLDKGFVGLFVGHSGCGKDCAEASFTRLGKMYVFDVDNRIRGLLASAQWLGIDAIKNIDFDFYNPRDGFKAIDNKLDSFLQAAQKRQLEYKTICLNSTSSLVYSLAIESRIARGEGKGREVKGLKFTDPGDYNFMSMAMRQFQFLYAMPLAELGINVIFSGHLVDRWEKPRPDKEAGITEYSPSVVTGHKLLGPDKLAEELPGYFDEVYLFKKMAVGNITKYEVEFSGQFAKTTLPIAGKTLDLTNKAFYDEWKKLVELGSYIKKG